MEDASAADAPKRTAAVLVAFTIQCAQCLKWRKVPTAETYERIRANISKEPFVCEHANEWNSGASCDAPPDLVQDDSVMWAMDRQDIPQPPPNWRRKVVLRGGQSNKFADVYYYAPCGKCLRSTNDIEKYLVEHPDYVQKGVTVKQFSYSAPRPLPRGGQKTKLPTVPSVSMITTGPPARVTKRKVENGQSGELGSEKLPRLTAPGGAEAGNTGQEPTVEDGGKGEAVDGAPAGAGPDVVYSNGQAYTVRPNGAASTEGGQDVIASGVTGQGGDASGSGERATNDGNGAQAI